MTDHLLAAGRAAGARRFVAQSYAGWRYAPTGGPVQTEADPLDADVPPALRAGLAAILHLEQAVTTIGRGEGLVLRYGAFYGPGTGTSLAPDAVMSAVAGAGERAGCQATEACPALAWASGRR